MIDLVEVWIAILGGAAVSVVAGLAAAVLTPFVMPVLRRVRPGLRAGVLSLALVAPLLAGLGTALIIAFSSHALPLDLIRHHCHAELASCAAHAQPEGGVVLTMLGAGCLGAVLVWLALSAFDLAAQSRRSFKLLEMTSRQDVAGSHILETDRVVALSAGLLRPRAFISEGLRQRLGGTGTEIVLSHERAHMARRDAFVRVLTRVFSIGHLPASQRRLSAELELAQEQLCDGVAARRHGEIAVAETLLAVARLKQAFDTPTPPVCVAFGKSDIEERTRALIAPNFLPTSLSLALFVSIALLSAAALFLAAEPIHHEIEDFFLSLEN